MTLTAFSSQFSFPYLVCNAHNALFQFVFLFSSLSLLIVVNIVLVLR